MGAKWMIAIVAVCALAAMETQAPAQVDPPAAVNRDRNRDSPSTKRHSSLCTRRRMSGVGPARGVVSGVYQPWTRTLATRPCPPLRG